MMVLAVVFVLVAFAAGFWIAAPLKGSSRWLAPALTVGLVLVVSGAYMIGGRPDLPGLPHEQAAEQRRNTDPSSLSLAEQIESLRDRTREDDTDAEAWALLGRQLARAEREQEAIEAFQRSLRIDPVARTFSDIGQTLINLNEGEVTPESVRAFEEAMNRDPDLPEPYFFLGLAAYQAGDRAVAADFWTSVLERLPADSAFRPVIARQAVDLLSRPDVNTQAVAEQADTETEPQARIAQMVARLETRLAADPDDISGWLVLLRVRRTLGDEAAARDALGAARDTFETGSGEGALLDMAAALMGLNEEDPS
ncbi:tetratricopeptide repeat protein [Hyphobacterium marinum]|uniref:Tetratricopeptide repeat protein n=1 Tax=Hyphobacterium marinum TaxID=3116574 RepID=A0ABU7M0H5_9PROT|nr:tetratricopeptide repeat protein [Hyphobacterium sp. Y6023]MEE2567314.1 tetratricopeptide repeat protein [Hyphobacterium sp. Y6023]